MPAQSASGPPVPVLGTQLVLLALPLQQQLFLVRAGRLILHAHHGRCACWMLHTFVLHARRLHLPRGAPPVHSAAAGSRTACHPSFHTCPSSHTVGSGPNTGRKVRGVPGVPPVAKEAPFSSARHGSRSGPTDRARAARSRAAPRPASANAARAPPPCSPWPRRAAAASQPRRRRPCSFSD